MSENKPNKTSILDSLMHHSKKIIIGLVALTVILSATTISVRFLSTDNTVVASYAGKNITKTEYDDAKIKCESFYKFNKDNKGKENCADSRIEDQIFRKALETEAEKRGITVTDAEVNKRYADMAVAYGGEDQYKASLKITYNWTPEYVKGNFRRDILQEKLEPYLIASRDGYGVFVRWDWSTGAPSAEQRRANQAPSRELLEKNLYPLMQSGASKEVLKAEIARLRTLGSPWDKEYNIGLIPFKGLNSKTGDSVGPEDWESISKLQKPGDTTGVIKSSLGQFSVYRLEKKTNGNFNGWEEFKKEAVNKAKIRSVSYKYNNIKKIAFQKVNDYLNQARKYLHIGVANAANCWDMNFSEFYAYVHDGSDWSTPIGGVSVVATSNTADASLKCAQEQASYTVYSNYGPGVEAGGFTIGQRGRYDGNGAPLPSAPWMLSCWHGWYIDITHPNYESIQYNADTAPNGSRSALDSIQSWEYYHGPPGLYATYNTDGNGHIFMKPKIITYTLTVNKAGTGTGTVTDDQSFTYNSGASKTFNSGNQPTLTATPDSNSTFDGWSGDCSGTGTSVVTMNGNKTCTATFSKHSNTCPVLKANNSTGPISIKQGGSVKLSWSGGYNVTRLDINQQIPPSVTLATIVSGVTPISGGSLDVMPTKTTIYNLHVKYDNNDEADCPSAGITVTVNQKKSGGSNPVAP